MYKFSCLLIVGFLFCCINATAQQTTVDSLRQIIKNTNDDSLKAATYLELSFEYRFNQPAKSIECARQALFIFENAGNLQGVFDAYGSVFNAQFYAGMPSDSLLETLQRSEAALPDSAPPIDHVYLLWNYAMYYGNIRQSDLELEYYLKALKIVRDNEMPASREAKLLNNIGSVVYLNGNPDQALHYYKQAEAMIDGGVPKANMLSNIGEIYLVDFNKIDSAQIFLNQALRIYKQENDQGGIGSVYSLQAKALDLQKKWEMAEELHLKAIKVIEDSQINAFLYAVYGEIANHYFLRKEYSLAIQYGRLAIDEILKQENYFDAQDYFEMLHQSYAQIGKYEEAYQAMLEYSYLKDSLNNVSLQQKVKELNTKFNVEQKEIENQLLRARQIESQQTIQIRTYIALASLLGLLLVVFFAYSIYKTNQRKNEVNQLLESEVQQRTSELQLANKNLQQVNYELRTLNYLASHDIKEPIRNIGTYADVIYRQIPDALQSQLARYFEIIKKSTAHLQFLIEDFSRYISLSKDEKVKYDSVDLLELIETLEKSILPLAEHKNPQLITKNLEVIYSNRSLLMVAIKNIIENAIKFNESTPPLVTIELKTSADHYEIAIEDNGIGIPEKHQQLIFEMFKRLHNREQYPGTGIGLAITALAIKKLNGQVKVESQPLLTQGSRFIIQLPIPEEE
ncbi:MAG: tetratricopeptide repeat-containing sensor histidine kinase [Saprospiraceae bacterium]|nr:tetratricopeptide repeat-containing sensor histidine kinase [Saprospiraceae bacterium]